MACFITPLITGIVIDLLRRFWARHSKINLGLLELMLIGGALVLMVEHAWHGEIVPYPPFLTAMKNPEDIPVMLHEVSIVGGSMTLAVVALWTGIVFVSKKLETKLMLTKQVITTLKTHSG
ncbi:MAG: hypothetical protein QXW93_06115 [Desulfurococcaceae archaeon]